MYRVGIIGPESCGKSTLGQYFARRYSNAVCIDEYAREYVAKLNRPYTYEDVEAIARKQIEQISQTAANPDNDTVYFFDTELIVTKVWFEHCYHHHPEWLDKAIQDLRMDCYLLVYPDIDWVPDPTRENPHIRQYLFDWYKKEIENLSVPYYIIRHLS